MLLSRITFEEKMLRKLPHTSAVSSILVKFPSQHIVLDQAKTDFQSLLNSNNRFHRLWFSLNLAALPLTAAAGVLPGPNVSLIIILKFS
jgi:hypothetical protein